MTNIVVDANIVFSAILNPNNKISEILFNGHNKLKFYSSNFLRKEINKHFTKILRLSKTSKKEVDEIIYQVYKRIEFIADQQIPVNVWYKAFSIVKDVDKDDMPYVALTLYLNGKLWTGDHKLKNGLLKKDFTKCVTQKELIDIIYEA